MRRGAREGKKSVPGWIIPLTERRRRREPCGLIRDTEGSWTKSILPGGLQNTGLPGWVQPEMSWLNSKKCSVLGSGLHGISLLGRSVPSALRPQSYGGMSESGRKEDQQDSHPLKPKASISVSPVLVFRVLVSSLFYHFERHPRPWVARTWELKGQSQFSSACELSKSNI